MSGAVGGAVGTVGAGAATVVGTAVVGTAVFGTEVVVTAVVVVSSDVGDPVVLVSSTVAAVAVDPAAELSWTLLEHEDKSDSAAAPTAMAPAQRCSRRMSRGS
jgi:hypothetical protein